MEEVLTGKVYRHFKGNYYFVENVGFDIYKPLYYREDGRTIWVRPEKMFLEAVPSDRPDNITGQTVRFKLCEEIDKNYIK